MNKYDVQYILTYILAIVLWLPVNLYNIAMVEWEKQKLKR